MTALYDFINDFIGSANTDYSGCRWMIALLHIKDNETCPYVESSWTKFVNPQKQNNELQPIARELSAINS